MRIDTVEGMAALFVVTGGAFTILERAFPERERAPLFARTRAVDWLYWPFSAFVTGNLTRAFTLGLAVVIAYAAGHRGPIADLPAWVRARSAAGLGALPLGVQVAIAIAGGDLIDYWNHRLRHTRALWPFHAVHHAPRRLDWLSSVRMHPVDDLCDNVLVGVAVLAAGVSLEAWLLTGPILFFFNAWLHANLPWRLGPLRYVIATPAFHRWHHADESAERSCNFAGVLPVWDLLFGTFHMPEASPRAFGPGATAVPEGLFAQLAFPFRVQAAYVASLFAEGAKR
jgi:sterol desaturase/sphingolipid hydroxylase (fatty acid hydroxylase superfamily)